MSCRRVVNAIGYVLMGFPRVSETFIASELHRVERAGIPVRLFVIKPVEARERELRHPVVDAIAATPEYLPDSSALTAPLHRWRRAHLRPFAPALRRVAWRRPLGLARACATALGQALRDRRTPLSGPRKIYVKELVQAVALADRVLAHPEVRHLHAHFAHGTTTVTWLAARIAGVPFSFTGHARDIYAPALNPRGWLRRKLLSARFVVTCTQANVAHLHGIAPGADVHLVYHGLGADFARLLEAAPVPPTAGGGTLRVLGVGRLVAKKGFDLLVEACALLRDRGVDCELRIVGQDDTDGNRVRERIATLGLAGRVTLAGPVGQAELLGEYRRADVLCMPCRLLADDRDGIPNVLVEAMAAGTPVVATAVSGIPELVRDGHDGLLVAPEDPAALAGALARLHADPTLAARLAAAGRETVARRFDGERLARRLADLFAEAIAA
ncbi:MAG TPA: glycosyltransferase [Solirubrobacteraceae bacterium]|jgi:glycosyltransferase involved in cell wall biosynthesis